MTEAFIESSNTEVATVDKAALVTTARRGEATMLARYEGAYAASTVVIMGDRTGLHPVTIIVAIFFWGTAFGGVLGMLLAIPLTAFFVTAWRLAKQKYFATPHA